MITLTSAIDGSKVYVNPNQICAVFTEYSGEHTIIQFSGSTRIIIVLESVETVYNLIKKQKCMAWMNGTFEKRAQG